MLFKETVTAGTLDLIQELVKDQQHNSIYLIGGTELPMRIDHRESKNIDLFSSSNFNGEGLATHLKNTSNANVKRKKSIVYQLVFLNTILTTSNSFSVEAKVKTMGSRVGLFS